MPMPLAIVSCNQKSHVTSKFDILDLWNVMVMLGMLAASCDDNTSANAMAWQEMSCCISFLSSWPKAWNDAIELKWHWHWHQWTLHDHKGHLVCHFDHLDIRNVMVLLTMPSASCDADAGANGVTLPKRSCCTSFYSSWPKECNGIINNAVCIT